MISSVGRGGSCAAPRGAAAPDGGTQGQRGCGVPAGWDRACRSSGSPQRSAPREQPGHPEKGPFPGVSPGKASCPLWEGHRHLVVPPAQRTGLNSGRANVILSADKRV